MLVMRWHSGLSLLLTSPPLPTLTSRYLRAEPFLQWRAKPLRAIAKKNHSLRRRSQAETEVIFKQQKESHYVPIE